MTLRCKVGDLAVIVGELPGCEVNIGQIVQVRGSAHVSDQCDRLLCWVIGPIFRKKMVNLYNVNSVSASRCSMSWPCNVA